MNIYMNIYEYIHINIQYIQYILRQFFLIIVCQVCGHVL